MTTMRSIASESWMKLGGPPAGAISALAVAEASEGARALFIGTKVGLYRSSGFDGGLVRGWDRLAGAPLGIVSLAVSPDFGLDRTIIAGTDTGIFISRDAGDTWAAAHIPHSRSMILALCFSPNYLADGIGLAGTLEDGVWLSDTRGESWQARSFGLLDATAFALAISPNFAADGTIYAGTDTAVYYSYNGARAWKQLHFPDDAAPVLSLAVSPDFASDHALYAGTEKNGLYRSVDRGQCWEKLDFPAASVNAMVASAKHGLLAATEAGVFLSRDKGDTWARLAEVADVISLAMKDDVAVAGLADQGAWMTTNLADWRPVATPSARSVLGFILSPEFDNDGIAFMYGLQEGVWKTEDGGTAWRSANENLPSLDIHALAASPRFSRDRTLVASSPDGLFLSRDAGAEWQALTEEAAGSVCFSPDGKVLAAAFVGEGIRLSGDMGRTWRQVQGPWDAGGKVVALAISGEPRLHVALLEGVDNVLSVWQGKPGQWENVLRHPTPGNPVVSLWIPPGSAAGEPWYASLGSKVWRFGARTESSAAEFAAVADASQREDIVTLTGVQHTAGCTLFACTGQHLYRSPDAKTWDVVHDFGEEPAIAFAFSPAYPADRAAYALLLGGAFCRGASRD